ncbi:hypothetical protein [Wolbachia endosymbiont (group A) of Tiphia femorata]|uniref:hypothetical protein n=1 Tax=Wolbachia endosymbiont (group A) of Tiphia femorata TaxID=2954063 RepID=UPI00222EEB41|nr:hypothetical protein [Wolbachia endosymbiont (group A) of Tiphia femorata]
MKFEMSEENSKRVLSGTKWIANVGQSYLASLNNTTSSGKKLINAFLLVPIIVPTAITVLSFGFTMLFLNAVSAQKDDSKLSKVIKFIVKSLICIAAAAVLIPCIILNLVISLIPFLIFRAINKDMFSQKNIENNQGQPVNKVEVNNGEEYNKRVEEEANKLGQQNDVEQDQSDTDLCQPLMRSGQLHNQPNIEVISRVVEGVDETVIAKHINNDGIQDGKAVIRTVGNDRNFTVCSVVTGDATNQQESFATAMKLSCNIVENGIDMQFGCSMRTGDTKQEAKQALMQSESARTLLSGNSGILSIEQLGSSQRK